MSSPQDYEGYLFAYFEGDSLEGENVFFALSNGNTALDWRELNGGQLVLSSKLGTKGLRDPFLVRAHNGEGFFLLTTDLSIGSGTSWQDAVASGSRFIEIFWSKDLINWERQRHVEVATAESTCAWAPKAYFNPEENCYRVLWSSTVLGSAVEKSYHRVFSSKTEDFISFSEPEVWIDAGDSVIDISMLRAGERWHRFSKSEPLRTGFSDVLHETTAAANPFDKTASWQIFDSGIGTRLGLGSVEGPILVRANLSDQSSQGYLLFLDQYLGSGYVTMQNSSLDSKAWALVDAAQVPKGARHGSILSLTALEMQTLRQALGH